MGSSPAKTEVDRQPGYAQDGDRAAENDAKDLQAHNAEQLAVIEHRQDRGYEKQDHVADQPFGATSHAQNAEPSRGEQQQNRQHTDDAARYRQTGEPDDALPGEPEGQHKPDLQRPIPVDEALQARAD